MVYRIPDSVNHIPNPLKKSYWAAIPSAVLLIFVAFQPVCGKEQKKAYDPKKGFKPAQSSLTSIMLQLAGSLEHHGSPEPYIRHVLAEHKRIDAKYAKATSKKSSSRPEYLTGKYVENLITNWKKLEKPLKLDGLCRESGKNMRHAIQGTWNKSVEDLLAEEVTLNKEEKEQYRQVLLKKHFTRKDFPFLEEFYADGGAWDKLTTGGKDQVGYRLELGMRSAKERAAFWKRLDGGTVIVVLFNEYQEKLVADLKRGKKTVNSDTLEEILRARLLLGNQNVDYSKLKWTEKDAIRYSRLIKAGFEKKFFLIQKKLPKQQAETVCGSIYSMVENLLVIAHSELRAAMREDVADRANGRHEK